MKTFSYSKDCKRDLKKLALTPDILMSAEMIDVMYLLQNELPLPEKYRDHALTGNWDGFRDCHIKNDLVLIYQIREDEIYLARLNTHSEVFK
ncbi:addiction module toxin RelE [Pasteurellaceae bacterium LFhippo2]|nr:addiction module toxin RelE [Pasteurellaceae bacterium LFhippo2]OOH91847.1 addiction module toxin RelE [Pasteurellaceae bacterium 15-036681]